VHGANCERRLQLERPPVSVFPFLLLFAMIMQYMLYAIIKCLFACPKPVLYQNDYTYD